MASPLLLYAHMGTRAWIATLFIPLICCAGCGQADDSERVAESIHQVLAGKAPAHVSADAWKDTHEFYSRRRHAPAWMMDDQAQRRRRTDQARAHRSAMEDSPSGARSRQHARHCSQGRGHKLARHDQAKARAVRGAAEGADRSGDVTAHRSDCSQPRAMAMDAR